MIFFILVRIVFGLKLNLLVGIFLVIIWVIYFNYNVSKGLLNVL